MAKRATEEGAAGAADSALQELYKMGAELQQQHEVLLQQLSKIGQSIHRTALATKSAQAAIQYVGQARPEAKVYRQIARVFVLESRGPLVEDLKEKAVKAQAEQARLSAVREQLLAKVSSVEEQTKDVLQQISKAVQAGAAVPGLTAYR